MDNILKKKIPFGKNNKIEIGEFLAKILLVIVMLIITVLVLYPLLFVVATSFKNYVEFLENPFSLSLAHPENYIVALKEGKFAKYFMNSAIVAIVTVAAKVFMSAVVAFAMGTLEFKGSKVVMVIFLATMFFTGEITGIPTFILIREIKAIDTLWALIIPGVLGPAGLGAVLGVAYVKKIPQELHEAALLDGASILQIFWHIDFKLMKPMLALIAIQTFQGCWSDFFWPLITIPTNSNAKTLTLGLISFQSQNNSEYGILSAGLVILTLPIIILYGFLSDYFLEGVSAGAVKS